MIALVETIIGNCGSVAPHAGDLDVVALGGDIAGRPAGREERRERVVQIRRYERRCRVRPTISAAVQPNIASAAALNEPIVPSSSTVRIPSAAFSTTARWCASLRSASSRARAACTVCSASSASARSLCSPIAPAIRIAIPNTNAPRKPIVCACDRLKNDGIQPSSTNSWPTAHPASDHPSACAPRRRPRTAGDRRAPRTRTPSPTPGPSRSGR